MSALNRRQQLGSLGETLAAEFLLKKGYRLLARNYRLPQGEIDLLMQDGSTVVVVEVKTQTSSASFNPIYKINPAKQRKLWLLARVITAHYPASMVRIDAVTLYGQPPTITHLENIIS